MTVYGVNLSYISYYYVNSKNAKGQVQDLIQTYKEYMTIEQIQSLERWCNNQSFRDAIFWNAIPNKNLEDLNGKTCLIDEFCKMYRELKRIEKLF